MTLADAGRHSHPVTNSRTAFPFDKEEIIVRVRYPGDSVWLRSRLAKGERL